MARSLLALMGILSILLVAVPAAGTATTTSSTDECEWYCKEVTDPESDPGRFCTPEPESGENAGPWELCENATPTPAQCSAAYGVESCHECDITPGDCDGSGSSLAVTPALSPSGTVLHATPAHWQSEDGALRSGCAGLIIGYAQSAKVLWSALATVHI